MNFLVSVLTTGVVLATPLSYAALGELISERSGVLNLGVEGMMLVGAVVGFVVQVTTHSPYIAFAAACGAGGVMGLAHAFVTVTLRGSQIVMGLTLTILGMGLSAYLGSPHAEESISRAVPKLPIPILDSIPYLGNAFFRQDPLVYGVFVLTLMAGWALDHTRWGLALRATGESPFAVDAGGVSVFLVRYIAVTIGGALAGLGGGYLSIVYTGSWSDDMTQGMGWIAIALVIFSSWRPSLILPGALLFGSIESVNYSLQARGVNVPSNLLGMLPYVITLVVLMAVWTLGRKRQWEIPRSLGEPYEREARV